jgi:putative NIF3 family GTP cyclohydrolase 1 type 2
LDAHPQLGNNVLIARELDMQIRSRFLSFEGRPIGCVCDGPGRAHLRARLDRLFPNGYRCIEFGDEGPGLVAISSGGGNGAFEPFLESEARTLITGELSQHLFSEAAENRRNVYVCGHYATETFGVRALAAAAADAFGLPWQFIDTACPL